LSKKIKKEQPPLRGFIINYLLLIIALLLSIILFPIGFIWALFRAGSLDNYSLYLLDFAKMIDRTGNFVMSYMFNDLLITQNGYKYGQKDETISGVTGKNYINHTLTGMGDTLANTLDDIQQKHVEKAIDDNPSNI